MNKKIIFILLSFIVVALGGWYYFSVIKKPKVEPAPVVREQPKPAPIPKEEPVTPFTEGEISLKENSSSKIGDLVFSVLKIYDSRCPVGVQCIWAGELKADVLAEFGGQTGTTTVTAGKEPVSLIGLMIEASSSDQVAPGTQPLKITLHLKKQ